MSDQQLVSGHLVHAASALCSVRMIRWAAEHAWERGRVVLAPGMSGPPGDGGSREPPTRSERLYEDCRSLDQATRDAAVTELAEYSYEFAYKLVRWRAPGLPEPDEIAADIRQMAIVRVWSYLPSIEEPGSLLWHVKNITRQVTIDVLKRESRI